jgi:hypothetical protein
MKKKTHIFCRLDTYVENFGLAKQRLVSACDHINTSTRSDANNNAHPESQFVPSTNEQQSKTDINT